MANIPAICETPGCLTLFPSGVAASNCRNITIKNCKASPCPVCGGVGRIPDGQYSVIEEKIFAALSEVVDVSVFKKIQKALERELNRNKSPKNIIKKLNKQLPEQKELWRSAPTNKRDALWYLQFILQSAAAIAALYGAAHIAFSDEEKDTIINNFNYHYHESGERQNPGPNGNIELPLRNKGI
jgi:hypothetical protein